MREPVQERAIAKRDRLVDAAYSLVLEKGYAETGIRDIVKRAEVSIGTFYAYFKDKGDIGLEIMRRYSQDVYGEFSAMIKKCLPPEASLHSIARQLLSQMLSAARKHPELHREIAALTFTDESVAAIAGQAEMERLREETSALLDYFAAFKTFDPEPATVWVILRFMDDLVANLVSARPAVPEKYILEEAASMLAAYMNVKLRQVAAKSAETGVAGNP